MQLQDIVDLALQTKIVIDIISSLYWQISDLRDLNLQSKIVSPAPDAVASLEHKDILHATLLEGHSGSQARQACI